LIGLTSRLVAAGLTIGTTLLLARYLGPEPTGQYFLFLRVVALLAVFADLGFSQSTNVFAGRGESVRQMHAIIGRFSMLASAVLLGVFLIAMALIGKRVLPNYPRELQIATIISVPFFVYSTLWNYLMIGLGQIVIMNAVQVGAAVVTIVAIGVLIVGMSVGVVAAVAVYCAVLVLQTIAMVIVVRRLGNSAEFEARPGLFREMWAFGLRGSGGSVAAILWPRIPVFVLNVFHGAAAVGVFSVGQTLVEKMLLPVQATQEAIYRRMARLDPEGASSSMNRYIRISGWSMLLFFTGVALLLPFAVMTVLGEKYRAAVPVILVLVPAALMMAVSLLLATFFLAHLGRPGLLSILALVNLALNAALSFALIPHFGALGAATAVAITQVIGTLVVLILYLRETGAHPLELLRIDAADREAFLRQVRDIVWLRNQER